MRSLYVSAENMDTNAAVDSPQEGVLRIHIDFFLGSGDI